jgi:hypothetical protein
MTIMFANRLVQLIAKTGRSVPTPNIDREPHPMIPAGAPVHLGGPPMASRAVAATGDTMKKIPNCASLVSAGVFMILISASWLKFPQS